MLVVDDGPRPAPQEDGSVGDSKPSTILDCTSTLMLWFVKGYYR